MIFLHRTDCTGSFRKDPQGSFRKLFSFLPETVFNLDRYTGSWYDFSVFITLSH